MGIIFLFRSPKYQAEGGHSLERPPDLYLSADAVAVIIEIDKSVLCRGHGGNYMILMLDTTENHIGKVIAEELLGSAENAVEFELIDTAGMHISHCVGCNYCWLKTPGICAIQDDYEPILRKMSGAEQVWLVSDTHFGFVSWQTKNIVDRIMPLVTMYLKFKDGQMRHVMRYDHQPDIGIIYTGDGDQAYLERWCQRTALNLGSRSLGVFSESSRREAMSCML